MEVPILSHARFAILSALIDGQPRTHEEMRERLGAEILPKLLEKRARHLADAGLIQLSSALRRSPSGTSTTARVLVITEFGKDAWREQCDFYLHYIQRFGSNVDAGEDGGDILAMKPIATSRKYAHRLPTDVERSQMRECASREELRTWDVIEATTLTLDVLFSLGIRDVDLSRAAIRVNRRWLSIGPELTEALAASIGKRTEGPALITRFGREWTRSAWANAWCRLRKLAGITAHVVIRPRPNPNRQKRRAL